MQSDAGKAWAMLRVKNQLGTQQNMTREAVYVVSIVSNVDTMSVMPERDTLE